MEPAVITFRPDNLLTVGLLGALSYVSAMVLVQLLMRTGLIASAPAAASAAPAAASAGSVATG